MSATATRPECRKCFQQRISKRTCEQSGVIVVILISNEDQLVERAVEQTTDVPVSRLKEHLENVPKIVFPSLWVVEEPVFKVFSVDIV